MKNRKQYFDINWKVKIKKQKKNCKTNLKIM